MKVLLIGHLGRMGKMMAKKLEDEGISYLGIDKDSRHRAEGYAADVIVDFSSSQCLCENLDLAQKNNIPIVIATTNHSPQNIEKIPPKSRQRTKYSK